MAPEDLCPACGSTLPQGVVRCPTCGNEVSEATKPSGADSPETPTQSHSPGVCRDCGTALLPSESACGFCGLRVPAAADPALATVSCPACGALVRPDAETCSACGVLLLEPPEPLVREPSPPAPPDDIPLPEPRVRATHEARAEDVLERAAYATAPAVPALWAAFVLGSTVGLWIVAAGLAALLATAVSVLLFAQRPYLGTPRTVAVLAGSTCLAVPAASALAALPLAWETYVGSAVVGAGLLLAATWGRLASTNVYVPWCAALPALLASAVALIVNPALGGTAATATWALAGGPLGITLAIVVRRRWTAYAAAESFERGRQDYRGGQPGRSLAAFDRALASTSDDAGSEAAWFGKGVALMALGRHLEALACLEEVLLRNPENEVALLNKGNALTKLGRLVEALRSYNAALKVNPQYEIAWNNKGNALARIGRYEEALACYDRALGIDATYRAAWVNKGFAFTKMGRFDDAARCAENATRLAHASVR